MIENSTPQDVQSAVLAPMFPTFPRPKQHPASTRHSTSSSARACRASLRPIMPPQAARLDPSDTYCSRNPPPPHLPLHAMRPRSSRERRTPSASHRLPTPARRCHHCHRGSHETRPLLPIPHPCPARARPTALPLFRQESKRAIRKCSPITARLQSERRGRERACRRPRLDAHAATCCP